MYKKEYNKFWEDRDEYFSIVQMERAYKIDKIPRAIASKDLKKQLQMKLDKYIQHTKDLQLNKKRLLDLDLQTLIKQIKKEEFEQRVRGGKQGSGLTQNQMTREMSPSLMSHDESTVAGGAHNDFSPSKQNTPSARDR